MPRTRPAPLDGWEGRTPPPFLAVPYPLDEYLDALPGDYGKIARRLLRAACWKRQATRNGIELDAGEVLIDERSEELWGGLVLDRDTTAKPLKEAGRRALVRRVLDRLEADEVIARRSAQARGPRNGPHSGPRSGPSPTVVRFLKFRAILWPASSAMAQDSAQETAQETAQDFGPIPPVAPPDQPGPPSAGRPAVAREGSRRDTAFDHRARDPQVEDLRLALAEVLQREEADFPVSSSSSEQKRAEVERELAGHIRRLGADETFAACFDVARIARYERGQEVESLAYFPGWLRTVKQPRAAAGGPP